MLINLFLQNNENISSLWSLEDYEQKTQTKRMYKNGIIMGMGVVGGVGGPVYF